MPEKGRKAKEETTHHSRTEWGAAPGTERPNSSSPCADIECSASARDAAASRRPAAGPATKEARETRALWCTAQLPAELQTQTWQHTSPQTQPDLL